GLSLCKELSEMMGGSIEVTSELGVGSRFCVRLPRTPDLLATVSPAEPKAPRLRASAGYYVDAASRGGASVNGQSHRIRAPERKARLLVAEDNADMRTYLGDLLTEEYDVELVTNGREALEAAAAAPPDVILSDVMMPEMDGVELVSRLKGAPELRD